MQNKIGNETDSTIETRPDDGGLDGVDLQSVFDDILKGAGREPGTLWRGYQIGDGGQEVWKYVPERQADAFRDQEHPMFMTVLASTYRSDGQGAERADALSIGRMAYFDFDFDSEDIAEVLPKVRQFIGKLVDAGADATALHIYASGGKGFHVLVPLEMFLPEGVRGLSLADLQAFHLIVKAIAQALYVDTLDLRVYTSSRMWRQANVKRERGTYKVPVTWAELLSMNAEGYAALVAGPRDEIPRQLAQFAPGLGEIWNQARVNVGGLLQAKAQRGAAPRRELGAAELERLVSALFTVDPDAGGYGDWFACVAAVHDAFEGSDEGLRLADEWSRQGRKYNRQALASTWDGLGSGLAGANAITAASVYRLAREAGWIDKWPHLNPRNQLDSPQYRLRETDEGFAEHVAAKYGDRLRYVAELKTWAVFDGRSWVFEHGIATAKDLAKREAREYAAKVVAIRPATDAEEAARKKSLSFALGLENGKKLENIVSKMQDDPRLVTSVGLFDDRPYLINLVNGTYDLDRDEMRGHDADDFLTQRMHVSRDPKAQCARWSRFIDEITCGDRELAAYLQCIAGLCLSGDVSRQEAYLCYGGGANGKSVFTGVIRELCGDYFKPLAVEVLVYSNKPGTNNTEMAALRGARAVATSELDRGVQLRSGNFKDLTGGDAVQVSDKYIKAFTLKPQCTILIPTNHLPTITENDHGTWRRVCIIPFRATFSGPELDPGLPGKLRAELPGILNWAIEGFRMFKGGKMVTPLCVKELTAKYRDELNVIKSFVDTWLVEDEPGREDRGRIKLDDLYVMYALFCKVSGLRHAMTKRMFKEDIASYLVNQTLSARQPVYWGWRIRAEYVPDNILTERFSKPSHATKSLQMIDEVED